MVSLQFNPSDIKLSHLPVIFLPWSYHETSTRRDAVEVGRENPSTSSFTFSSALRNVEWAKPQLDAAAQASMSDIFGQSPPALISWEYNNPVCMGLAQDLGLVDPKYHATIKDFKLLPHGHKVQVMTKGSKNLVSQDHRSLPLLLGSPLICSPCR